MNHVGRSCAKVPDGIATNCKGWYYLSSKVLNRILSPHMWQMALANDHIMRWTIHLYANWFLDASSQILVCPSHYTEVLYSCMTCGVALVIYKGGALICFLNLSQNVLEDSPMYSSSLPTLPPLYLYTVAFLVLWKIMPVDADIYIYCYNVNLCFCL